jgi:putative transcriptional regulator
VNHLKRDRLIHERLQKRKTQAEVAQDIGISEVYVRKLESGTVDPGRKTMFKFEEYYSVDAKLLFPDLFFESNDKKCIKPNQAASSA